MPTRLDLSRKPNVYGWAAMVDFTIDSRGGFKELGEGKSSLLWSRDLIVTIEPKTIHPILAGAGAKGFRMIVEAADTACGAEQLGLGLAHALLSVAIERHWGLSLSWPDQPLPCRVIDRTASKGLSAQGFGSVTSYVDTQSFIDAIDDAFVDNVPHRVLLSMELCASSRLENDNRAKLIMLVSAIESLAEQRDLSTEAGSVIDGLISTVSNSDVSASLRNSLIGQIRSLNRESVRRAIRRFMAELELDGADREFIEIVYGARSKIVHEGWRVAELDSMTSRLDAILCRIYRELSSREQEGH